MVRIWVVGVGVFAIASIRAVGTVCAFALCIFDYLVLSFIIVLWLIVVKGWLIAVQSRR
jgi:hypothetical protein